MVFHVTKFTTHLLFKSNIKQAIHSLIMNQLIGKKIHHYKILEQLGVGGMGIVFKAQDLKLDRIVALKFLPHYFSADEERKKRFIQEAKAASALDHPNICTIHEINSTEDGQIFIAMSYYEGETLKQRIEQGPLSMEDALDITIQMAEGLSNAHEKGILHRDIKPGNIIITKDGTVKIVDFGIAKIAGLTMTKSNTLLGTVAYASPEQLRGQTVDQRSDIWSIGVVLSEMLTGELPFKGEYEEAMYYSILNEEPETVNKLQEVAPRALTRIVHQSLEKDPNVRYDSCTSLLTDLKSIREEKYSRTTISVKEINKSPLLLLNFLRKHPIGIIIGITGILIILILYHLLYPPISLTSTDYIMVSEFQNDTNEDIFNHSLTEALRVTLRQSSYINLISSDRITNALKRMKLPQNQKLDEATSLAIAQRENAPFVISGNIAQIGMKYVLTSKIIDSESGEILKIQRIELNKIEDVLKGMDKLVVNVREDLGESIAQISESSMPLAKVTTPSLKALQLYSRGNLLEQQGKYAEAVELKEKAIAIDSFFVMAISDLSYDYRKIGNHTKALYYHQKVLPLIDRVTERERFAILMTYYGPSFELDYNKALQIARKHILMYPNDALAYWYLGHTAMFAGDYQTAIESNQRALKLDSSFAGFYYSNTGFTYALAGNANKALTFLKKSKEIRPTNLELDSYIARVLWMKGDLDSSEIIFRSILPKANVAIKAKTHAQLVALYHFQGRLQNALDECRAGIEVCHIADRPEEESYFHYLIGEIERERGHISDFKQEMEESIRLAASPFCELLFTGASFAETGNKDIARELIRKLKSSDSQDPYFVKRKSSFKNYILGEIALADDNLEKAKQYYTEVQKLHSGDPIYLMAQKKIAICTARLQDTTAIRMYRDILGNSGEIFMAFLPSVRNGGFWTSRLYTETMFDLAKLYAQKKDTTNAIQYFTKALNIWDNADKDFQKAKEIHYYLAKLKSY